MTACQPNSTENFVYEEFDWGKRGEELLDSAEVA